MKRLASPPSRHRRSHTPTPPPCSARSATSRSPAARSAKSSPASKPSNRPRSPRIPPPSASMSAPCSSSASSSSRRSTKSGTRTPPSSPNSSAPASPPSPRASSRTPPSPNPAIPSEAELTDAYEASKSKLLIPRSYQLAQIYIAKDKAKLDSVQKQLKAKNADFAAIARATQRGSRQRRPRRGNRLAHRRPDPAGDPRQTARPNQGLRHRADQAPGRLAHPQTARYPRTPHPRTGRDP